MLLKMSDLWHWRAESTLKEIEEAGLYKNERVIVSPQRAAIKVSTGKDVLNFCANNYLGLSDSQENGKPVYHKVKY